MKDQQNKPPQDTRGDIEALIETLSALPPEVKATIAHCVKSGDTPPPQYFGLTEATKAALLFPSLEDAVYMALETPQTFIFHPAEPHAISREEAENRAREISITLRLINKEDKEALVSAIRDPANQEHFTVSQGFLWGQLLVALTFTAHSPGAIRDTIADALSVSAAELDTLTEETLKKYAIKLVVDNDTESYLPGMEPEKRLRYPAPTYIYPQYTMIPTAELARNIHNLDFQDTEAGAIAKVGIDRRPHSHYVYMLMLDKLAEQYPITAGDKNILIALGNLYGERLNQPGGKGIQGGSIITAADIVRRYRGLDASDNIDQQTIDAVTRRMAFLMKLNVSFDFSQHFEYRKKDIGDGEEVELAIPDNMRRIDSKTGTVIRFSYIGQMVHANIIEAEYDSGRVVTAWEILTPPIVFDYAQKIKQVATIETRLLDLRRKAKASTNNTAGADVMKIYLIERINAMIDIKTHRPKDAYSQTITLATMFEDLRIETNSREAKRKKVNMARDILDHFKETPEKHRGHFIKGYKLVKGYRGAVTGFEILF